MIVKILFGQMQNTYPDEYAPEALAIISEYDDNDNSEYMEKEYEKYASSKDYIKLAIVDVEINDEKLDKILSPETVKISGKIKHK